MPAEPAKPLRIFLSYARADAAAVRKLHRYLCEKGFDVWFDKENLVPGQDWQLEIEKGLSRSDVILVCLSQAAVSQEGFVQKEFKFALDRALEMPEGRIFLIPVRLQACEAPTRLSRYQWVDLFEREGYSRLMRGLKHCAEQLERARVDESQPVSSSPAPDTLNDISAAISDNVRGNMIHPVGDAEKHGNDLVEKNTAEQAEIERIAKQKTDKAFDSRHVRINPAISTAISPAVESPILLNLLSQTDEVEAGQTVTYELEIVNAGSLAASFNILIEGVPQEWVSISPEEINLYEGQHKRVYVNITLPQQPDSAAGQHELRVSVFSANYPGHQAIAPVFLRIKPYYEFMLDNLSPREQKMSWFKRLASISLPITNRGNCPVDFAVSASDDENSCSFDFVLADGRRLNRQVVLRIPAGQTLLLPIEISPHERRWIDGKRYSYTATVQVINQPVTLQTVRGSLFSQPLFPWWSIMLALFTLAAALFVTLQPNIYYFQVVANKDVIELGDSTRLDWSVSFFTNRVSISNTTQPLNNGQTSLTIAPTQSTTYELTAGSWLSGLLNMDLRESRTVLVVPPSPTINAFSVDNTRVAQGNSVKIRWSITQADQAILTVDDVSYELPKEQFSGEKDVVLTKDALVILEAKSAGGQALRSYFVNVVSPKITITTFIVWVKHLASKTGMSIKNGGGKLAAPSQSSPDPNFPDKYVELVPDPTGNNGYRVYFDQPDRELDKGEQVVVEWNVSGADNDKVQIAPFTDTLPAKGSQPFFPTESMNFVLTAKSGSLETIYMLPIKVFNGPAPTAPTIEFFQAVPMSRAGPGNVEFSWSVSGNWTRVQLASQDGIIGDYLNPQGFKTVRVSKSGTYILTAWNGDLSSAKPLNIMIGSALLSTNLEIDGIGYGNYGYTIRLSLAR
ncbi:MAG: TIR domain-containing protein [Anaerolineales bacterium]